MPWKTLLYVNKQKAVRQTDISETTLTFLEYVNCLKGKWGIKNKKGLNSVFYLSFCLLYVLK